MRVVGTVGHIRPTTGRRNVPMDDVPSPAASSAAEQTPGGGFAARCRRSASDLPSSADEVELEDLLRSGFVQVAEHELAGDPVEVAGAADDVQPVVASPKVAPVLDVAEATDLTV